MTTTSTSRTRKFPRLNRPRRRARARFRHRQQTEDDDEHEQETRVLIVKPEHLAWVGGHIGTNYPRTALIIVVASSASLVISFQELDLIRSFGASHEPPIAAMFWLAR